VSIVAKTDIAAAGVLRNANTLTPFMVFSVKYTICEGPKLDA
jgi:hypothetical protein